MQDAQPQLRQIAGLIREETTLSLATTGEDGAAAVAPLFYLADEELSLFWLSSSGSLHSRNLIIRPEVAVTIYRSVTGWRQIRGVQMRGRAGAVGDSELRSGLLESYAERFRLGRIFRPLLGQSTLYGFRPEFIRFIDNTRRLGGGFELVRGPQGWSQTRARRMNRS
ncbi:MAG: pyridoxamine 5'-phosphate oxidase family protein [Terracidiphilus sp.]